MFFSSVFSRLSQRLARPYPANTTLKGVLRHSLGLGLFVFLFLWIFLPFGLSELQGTVWDYCLGYGLVTFSVSFVMLLLLWAWLAKKGEHTWTTGKNILWALMIVALVGLGNLVFSSAVGFHQLSWNSFLSFEIITLAVGFFPISFSVLLAEARQYRHYALSSHQLSSKLGGQEEPEKHYEVITFPTASNSESLTINPQQLRYAQAADNYVEVFYFHDGALQSQLLRTSLKAVAEELAAIPYCLRCHKSYLVNLQYVAKVTGNAQGYRLHLHDAGQIIPVSRQWNGVLKEKLKGYQQH